MKKTVSRPSEGMDFIFSMLLFLVFILCSVFTILIGSRVYGNIRARNDAAFYSDTALSLSLIHIFVACDNIIIRKFSRDDTPLVIMGFNSQTIGCLLYTSRCV